MSEFLIKAVDAIHGDPDKDKFCYKRGDIVVAMPDGHQWGNEECLPKFYVFKIPGLPIEEARQYAEPAYVLGHPDFGIAVRRKHRFPFWAKVPAVALDKIAKSSWLVESISLADIEVK